MITDEDGNEEKIKTIIKNTILALEPEINDLKIGHAMDKLLERINLNHSYYMEQKNLYKRNNSFKDVITSNIEKLKK